MSGRRGEWKDGEVVRIRPLKGRPRPIRSSKWEAAKKKQTPKAERPVTFSGIALLPGNVVTIQGKKVRVTEDGEVEVRGLFGWKPEKPRRR